MHKRNRNDNSSQHLTTSQFSHFKVRNLSLTQTCTHTHTHTYPALLFIFSDEVRESLIKTQSTTSRVQTGKLVMRGDIRLHTGQTWFRRRLYQSDNKMKSEWKLINNTGKHLTPLKVGWCSCVCVLHWFILAYSSVYVLLLVLEPFVSDEYQEGRATTVPCH